MIAAMQGRYQNTKVTDVKQRTLNVSAPLTWHVYVLIHRYPCRHGWVFLLILTTKCLKGSDQVVTIPLFDYANLLLGWRT